MSHTLTIEQAAQQLAQLVGSLGPGDEIVLTQNHRPIAKIVPERVRSRRRRHAGMCKGMLVIKSDDDEHLKDFGIDRAVDAPSRAAEYRSPCHPESSEIEVDPRHL